MPDLYLLLNHELYSEQTKDVKTTFGIQKIHYLPEPILNLWANIPPKPESIKSHLREIFQWVRTIPPGNYILVQGDFGATFLMVQYAFRLGLIPLYATTERVHKETRGPSQSTNITKTFKHVRFRRYER